MCARSASEITTKAKASTATLAAARGLIPTCLVFKVAGKIFLIIARDAELTDPVVFKCDPADFDPLTEIDGVTQAPYCAKTDVGKSQRSRRLARAPELERHLRRSYDLVVAGLPKKTDLLSRSRFRLSKNQGR